MDLLIVFRILVDGDELRFELASEPTVISSLREVPAAVRVGWMWDTLCSEQIVSVQSSGSIMDRRDRRDITGIVAEVYNRGRGFATLVPLGG